MKKHPHILFIVIALVAIGIFTVISLIKERDIAPPGVKPPRDTAQPSPTPGSSKPTPTKTPDSDETNPPKDPALQPQIDVKVSGENRAPVKNAQIELYVDRSVILPLKPAPLASSRTNEKGEASLGRNLSGRYILKVSANSLSTELRALDLEDADSRKSVSLILKPETFISGIVKNKKGEPLPNITIGPLMLEPEAESRYPNLPEFTSADQKGRFRFRGLRNAMYSLQVTRSGYVSVALSQVKTPSENLEITLVPGGTSARGITAGSRDGQPCKDVGILLVVNNIRLYALSNEKGNFVFENLDKGEYCLEPILKNKRAGKPISFSCDGVNPVEDIIVKVNQGIIISGKTQDNLNKKPLEGILLEIKDPEERLTATSDDNGDFFFKPWIPEGGIDIHIASPEFYVVSEEGVFVKTHSIHEYMPDSDMEDIVISLDKEYALSGVVEGLKEEDRAKYKVKIQPLESESKRKTLWLKLGDDFTFSSRYMGSGGNVAGLFTEKGDLASEPLEFFLDPRNPTPHLLLKFSSPTMVGGRVLQHTGDPLENSLVAAEGMMSSHKMTTDESGMFSFETYEKRLSFVVSSPNYSQKLKRDIDLPVNEEIVFRFTLGKILTGAVVTFDESPVAFARISYHWLNPDTGANLRKEITADKNGVFSITDVLSDYIDRLICEGPETGETGSSKFGRVELEEIALPQEDFKIVLPGAINLTLNILDDSGNPYSGHVSVEMQNWKPDTNAFEMSLHDAREAREGKCRLDSLNPGIYAVHVRTAEGLIGSSDSIELGQQDPNAEATIHLHQVEMIYGYIYDSATNKSLEGVNIIFKSSERVQIQHGTTSNQEGYFEMKGLHDGNIRLQFGKNGYITSEENISISQGVADVSFPLSIYMEEAQSVLTGIVYNPQNKPEPAVSLTLRSLKADEEILATSRSGVTENDGRFAFYKLDHGEYLLAADKDHSSASAVVALSPQEKKDISITLKAKVLVKGTLETKQAILYEQPLLFSNRETQRNYLAHLTPDHKFEIYLPVGEYRINVGDSEISGYVSITDDADVFELDLSF
ncbi:carboxypeptidase regulatory-like domain-containing protein [Candidatus Sumerlaeota bacterium]|nr:carboxypeptidase regulatory-like domain-containing protein [Candidatus Sumerlaeota bacterium]